MATDPGQLLLQIANAPGLAAQSVFNGANNALAFRGDQQRLQVNDQAMEFNRLKMAAIQKEQGQEEAFQGAVQSYLNDPTPAALSGLMARFPDKADALKKSWDVKDGAVRAADMGQFGAIYSALANNKTDLALGQLRARRDAEKKRGIDTTELEHFIDALTNGDAGAIKAVQGYALAQIAAGDSDKFAEIYKTVGGDRGAKVVMPGGALVDGEGTELYRAPFAPRPVTVGEGQTVVEYQPEGGGPASGGGSSGGAAGALKTNPGALKDGPFARSQPGYTGSSGGFAMFETEAQGRAAQSRLLDQNYIRKGFDTPRKIVERYAPRGPENSSASVNNYAAYIAQKLGIGVDDPIAPNAVPKLAQAMREFETGNRSGSTGQSGGGPRVIAQGGAKATPQRMTAAEVAAEGLDPNTVYYRGVDGVPQAVGGQKAQGQLKPWPVAALAARSENGASLTNIENALHLLDPKNNSPAAKAARNAVGFGTGGGGLWDPNRTDPKGAKFRALIGQIGGIMIKEISGAAVSLSEDDRLKKWIPFSTDSPSTIRDKLSNLKREIAQRNAAMDSTYSEDQGFRPFRASRPGADPVRVRSIQEATKLPKGTIYVTPRGQVIRR